MKFTGVINYPLLELGLSQIYLNEDKVKAIEKWFNPDDMSIFEPLPVHDYGNGKYTLTDVIVERMLHTSVDLFRYQLFMITMI